MRRATSGLLLACLIAWAAGCRPGSSAPTAAPAPAPTPEKDAAPAAPGQAPVAGAQGGQPPPPPPPPKIPAGAVPDFYQMDPGQHTIPARQAFGRVAGRPFFTDSATIKGNKLTFRQGKRSPELEVEIEVPVAAGKQPDGMRFVVRPDQKGDVPKVATRVHKGKGEPEAKTFEKYALTLEFGVRNRDGLPGKVYLCLPDEQKSYLVGTFEAEEK